MRLLGHEGLAVMPSLRPVPTFIAVSGGIDETGEEDTSHTNGNPLATSAFATFKRHGTQLHPGESPIGEV
jgi:hypothetical protein